MSPTTQRSLSRAALWGYVALVTFFVIAPVLYALTGSMRTANPSTILEHFIPLNATFENFSAALNRIPLETQFVNSILVTLLQTDAQLVTSLLAATALVFGNLKRPQLWFAFIMLTMMIPSESIIVAKFLLVNDLGLFDTIAAVFLPFAAMAFPTFLLRQAFLSFPMEIREAALLDGVGPLRFVVQFLIPLTKPIIYSVVLTSAIAAWNGYFWPLLVTDTRARTVQIGIAQLSDAESTDVGVVLAGVTVVSIPLILMVILGQKFLAKGLTEGSNK